MRIILIIILLFPAIAFSAPEITDVSGTIEDGETITITGTGFTTHSDYDVLGTDYLCSWWDDFDSYEGVDTGSPNMEDNYNFEGVNDGQNCVRISTDQKRGTNSISIDATRSGCDGGAKIRPGPQAAQVDSFDGSGVVYYSMWMYFPSNWTSSGVDQWKIVRLFDGTPADADYYPCISQPGNGRDLGHHSDYSGSGGVANQHDFGSGLMTDGTVQGATWLGNWHRIEIIADSDNDELLYYIDGHLYYDGNASYGSNLFDAGWNTSGIEFFSISEVHHPDPINIGWFDDLYTSNTWARVEITQTNEFTVDTSKKLVKNIQLPKTWGTTEITADLNLEGLTGTVYLWVVDSNGDVSGSHELEVGQEIPTVKGLRIQ